MTLLNNVKGVSEELSELKKPLKCLLIAGFVQQHIGVCLLNRGVS